MNILVTGASGFIGSHLCNALKVQHNVVGLARDLGYGKFVWDAHRYINGVFGDASDPKLIGRVLVDYEIDTVVHLAAQAIVRHAKDLPALTIENNVLAGLNILECARQAKTKHVIIQSTDKVYGPGLDRNVGSPLIATEAYGTSKACVDMIAHVYGNVYGMNVIITRPCNIYGYDWNNRIVPNTIRKCMKGERPVIFKNDHSRRQYAYIDDIVNVFKSLISAPGGAGAHVVNVASDAVLDQEEVVKAIVKHFPGVEPEYVEKPSLCEIEVQSIEESMNGFCPTPFDEGIKKTIEEFRRWEP